MMYLLFFFLEFKTYSQDNSNEIWVVNKQIINSNKKEESQREEETNRKRESVDPLGEFNIHPSSNYDDKSKNNKETSWPTP